MLKSALVKEYGLYGLAGTLMMAMLSFTNKAPADWQLVNWSKKSLQNWFTPVEGSNLKRWELEVTPDYFLRLKKYYAGGKQEYYSFHLHKFKDINYLGTSAHGILKLLTKDNDIIVQTYNDPKGDIDSMTTCLDLPVRNVGAEQLDSLRLTLLHLKYRH